mgnify:CR=1 FL=1
MGRWLHEVELHSSRTHSSGWFEPQKLHAAVLQVTQALHQSAWLPTVILVVCSSQLWVMLCGLFRSFCFPPVGLPVCPDVWATLVCCWGWIGPLCCTVFEAGQGHALSTVQAQGTGAAPAIAQLLQVLFNGPMIVGCPACQMFVFFFWVGPKCSVGRRPAD